MVHGHSPLTALFTIDAMPGSQAAFRSLYDRSLDAAHAVRPLAEHLHDNFIPASQRDTPKTVLPYLIARDTFVQRLYAEHAGYSQANREGVEGFTRAEWALAHDELGDRSEDSFRRARALTTLRQINSQMNPFRFIVYSEWSGNARTCVSPQ